MGIFSRLKQRLTGSGKGDSPRVLPRPGQLGIPNEGTVQPVGVDDITKFVHFGEKIHVTSTNVAAAEYKRDSQELIIYYLDGSTYAYQNVSDAEAISFITTPSKGTWVWDHLRVRGSADAHQKPFVRLG